MPKQRPSGFIYAKSLPGGENVWQHNNSNHQVFCKACSVGFSYQAANLKYRIDSHYKTGKHEKQALQRNRQQTLVSNAATENEFEKELTRTFVMENILLAKVEGKFLKPFLEKYTGKVLPTQSTLRKTYLPKMYSEFCDDMVEKFKGKDYFMMVDEATDVCGRSVCGALIGTFDGVIKPELFDLAELAETNHRTISQLVISVNARLNGPGDFLKLKLLITDGAAYMVKAGKFLKEMFSDRQHVTCVVHMLHQLAEFVRSENLIADELCSLMKQLLLRSNTRKKLYKDITGLPLPPVPIIVRWGTIIVAIIFHAQNFSALEDFIRQLEFDGTSVVKRIKQLIADDEKVQCLKAQLALIAANFAFLPEAITKLQGRIPLADAFSVLNDVQAKVVLQPYKQKLDQLFSKNPDLDNFKEHADVLMGSCFQTNVAPETSLEFKNAPIANAEIERVFSKMSALLTPQRLRLTFEALKFHLMINWNCSEDFHNE